MDPPPVPVPRLRALKTLIELLRTACEHLPFRRWLLQFLEACGAARRQPRTAPDDVPPPLAQQQLQEEGQEEEQHMDGAKNKKTENNRDRKRAKKKTEREALKQATKADIAAVTAASTSKPRDGRAPNAEHDALNCSAKEPGKIAAKKAAERQADIAAVTSVSTSTLPDDRAPNDAHDALDYAGMEAAKKKPDLDALEQAAKAKKKAPKANGKKAVAAAAAKRATTAAAKKATQDRARAAKDADHSNGRAKEKEPVPSPSPSSASPTSAGPSSSSRQPELDPEEKERIAHKNYKVESEMLKKSKVMPCLICYVTEAVTNANRKVPIIANKDDEIDRHVRQFHKGGVKRCQDSGCFAFGRDGREIGLHQYIAHKMS